MATFIWIYAISLITLAIVIDIIIFATNSEFWTLDGFDSYNF